MSTGQLPLPLPHRARLGWQDFLVSPANTAAVAAMRAWTRWPQRRLVLVGPARSGKSHLARIWAAESGAVVIAAADLAGAAIGDLGQTPVLVEDIERPGDAGFERALFHLHNHLAGQGAPLLLTSRAAPAQMGLGLPDLASRLGAFGLARIGPPDDTLLSSLVIKHLSDRGLGVGAGVVEKLVRRMERSYGAAEEIAAALDTLSLARKKPVSGAMVDELLGTGEGQG